jgi:hypothetical protein
LWRALDRATRPTGRSPLRSPHTSPPPHSATPRRIYMGTVTTQENPNYVYTYRFRNLLRPVLFQRRDHRRRRRKKRIPTQPPRLRRPPPRGTPCGNVASARLIVRGAPADSHSRPAHPCPNPTTLTPCPSGTSYAITDKPRAAPKVHHAPQPPLNRQKTFRYTPLMNRQEKLRDPLEPSNYVSVHPPREGISHLPLLCSVRSLRRTSPYCGSGAWVREFNARTQRP